MKLCWDELEDVKLTSGFNNSGRELGLYWGVPEYRLLKYKLEYAEGCENCGNNFFRKKGSKTKFCCKECSKETAQFNSFKRRAITYVKRKNSMAPKNKLKSQERKKELITNNLMPYKTTPKVIKLCKTHRRHPEHNNVLQLKCEHCSCDKWYTPTYWHVRTLAGFISGNTIGNPMTYCSDDCYIECKGHMDIESIIADDLWLAGHHMEATKIRFKHHKRNPTPIKVKCNLAKQYAKQKPRYKIKPYVPAKTYYNCTINSSLNEHIIKNEKESYAARRKEWRRTDPGYKEYMRLQTKKRYNYLKEHEPKKLLLKRLLYYSRVRAKQKGIPHDITYDWLLEQIEDGCPKTGFKFNFDPNTIRDQYAPSIDRIDNSKGYTTDNCQVVIWAYNCAKGPYTDELLYTILKTII